MNVVILVPRRYDGGRRDQLWHYVAGRWTDEHPAWPIFEGIHAADEGPFNRSKAINAAAAVASNESRWDIAIIADSDSFVGPEQIDAAVELAARHNQMALAYDRFAYLSHAMSDQIMAGYNGDWWAGVEWYLPGSCSSMVVCPRPVWEEVEGFDEGFVGWGGEDVAFSHKAQTFGGGLQRVAGPVWHLWHAPAVHAANDVWVPRCERYAAAAYDRQKMHALMVELRTELDP